MVVASQMLFAQERVYVSTDKECYVAGESVWCSLYCLDEDGYSDLSSVAYLQFCSNEGVQSTMKVALVEGRGCGKFDIPFSFATGNYSIVAYTKKYGGNSVSPFNGKVISIFNTLSSERVKDGVEVVGSSESVASGVDVKSEGVGKVIIEAPHMGQIENVTFPVKLYNKSENPLSLSVSVYNLDALASMVGPKGYDNTSLLDRAGDFETGEDVDYSGELIRVKVSRKDGGKEETIGKKNLYLSALNGNIDLFISPIDADGCAKYYTNNIYGKKDLVFDVADELNIAKSSTVDGAPSYQIQVIEKEYKHTFGQLPVLKISESMNQALVARGMNMQIARRFDADTLYNLMRMRGNPIGGEVNPIVYNLDDYTRFPVMEDVVREYVRGLRIRKFEKKVDFQISWESYVDNFGFANGQSLALLDGVPVRDHKILLDIDPLLVKQIVLYPRQIAINNFLFDGIVNFKTYKGDMGGVDLGSGVSIVNYKGVEYPLAFLGSRVEGNKEYPNYNNTIYWNPVVDIDPMGTFEFDCVLPSYKGEFRIVVEGLDATGAPIYHTSTFEVK